MNHQLDIHAEITAAAAAAEKAEADARVIDQRMRMIPGMAAYLSGRRGHGQVRNPWHPASANLTIQARIFGSDRELAAWLANKAGQPLPAVDYQAAEAQQQATQQAHAMHASTEALARQNAAAQDRRYQQAVYGTKPAGAR